VPPIGRPRRTQSRKGDEALILDPMGGGRMPGRGGAPALAAAEWVQHLEKLKASR
jgi:hypothetical protein